MKYNTSKITVDSVKKHLDFFVNDDFKKIIEKEFLNEDEIEIRDLKDDQIFSKGVSLGYAHVFDYEEFYYILSIENNCGFHALFGPAEIIFDKTLLFQDCHWYYNGKVAFLVWSENDKRNLEYELYKNINFCTFKQNIILSINKLEGYWSEVKVLSSSGITILYIVYQKHDHGG